VSEIRSYRSVFELERRIYRIDRLRLNPGGIPVRGIVYWLAILAAVTVVGRVPLLGGALDAAPWYVRELAAPALAAGLLCVIRIEGRPFHVAGLALLRYAIGPHHLVGLCRGAAPGIRWSPPELPVLPDGSGARLRRLRYAGPGTIYQPATGRTFALERGARLEVG
jgi:hypothetical protein